MVVAGFDSLRPASRLAGQLRLWDNLWNDEFVKGFRMMERWGNETLPLPGGYFRQTVKELLRGNALYQGTLRIGGRKVDLSRITVPFLHFMASSYLANCTPGTRVAIAARSSNDHFHPPASPETPMVMVCAGTGLAPFRGFLQERAMQAQNGRSVGPSLLFFGCDHPDVDFLYRDELEAWQAAGVVSVRPAFFRQPEGDVTFVQHRVWQDRADVAELFRRGASVYVCGDGRHMAPAVRQTFVRIYQEAASTTAEQAEAWVDRIERETGRYVSDVFA